MFHSKLRKEVIKLFSYVKRSKVLDIIETERRKVVEDMEFLYETSRGKNNYLHKSAVLEGKHEMLIKLTEKIVRDGI
jgi:hypothetical protein